MSNGKKYDKGKPPMALLPHYPLREIAAVLGFGAQKYNAHNWRKGIDWSREMSALLRHLGAFNEGEDLDPESGLPHLAHAGCCLLFLMEFTRTHPELDDRWKDAEMIHRFMGLTDDSNGGGANEGRVEG